MESEDGGLFVKNLAYFVRTHEKALADSLLLQGQQRRHTHASSIDSTRSTTRTSTSPPQVSSRATPKTTRPSSWFAPLGRSHIRPARLFLTPNQLYYLLSRFDELGVNTGPINIRLENLHAEPSASSNYVSFLAQSQQPKIRSYDADSIHSVTSVRSLVSSVSHVFSNISFSGSSASKLAKQEMIAKDDVRYLYSAFTKVPCLKISLDHRLRPIAGYEEFPFDTAVPVTIFKNLTALEVADIDFRSVFGWDFLAENLQSLTVKRASLEDLTDLLNNVVLDDMDQRRRRSSKTPQSPGLPLATPSTASKYFQFPPTISPTLSPPQANRPRSSEGPSSRQSADQHSKKLSRSISPQKTPFGRKSSLHSRPTNKDRRASGSSASSTRIQSPRQSSTSLLLHFVLPSHKWRFLRHLSVPDNGLTSISAESLLPLTDSLQSLDLSSNLFTEIPDSLSSLVALRALNMSNCLIESLRTLGRAPLPAVTVLNLRANRLNSLAGIEKLKSLQRLDVRENRLTDPTEAARLTGMPDFYELYVRRNPFTRSYAQHRVIIFNVFRATPGYTEDISIDGKSPERGERRLLADRVREQPQSIALEATPEYAEGASGPMKGQNEQVGAVSVSGVEPQTPDGSAREKRRKAPKRRVVEIADQVKTPSARTDSEALGTTVFMTAREKQQTERVTKEQQYTQVSPTPQSTEVRRSGQTHSGLRESPTTPQSQSIGLMKSGNELSRPSLSRNISQSNEDYQKRIEALKNEQGDSWLSALNNGGAALEPRLDSFAQAHASTGVGAPIQASARTPVNT